MNSLQRRIEELERVIKARNGSMFSVHFKDGTIKKIHPGDVIKMSLFEADKIERFEEGEDRKNDGVLEGLANALLVSGNNEKNTEKIHGKDDYINEKF